MQFEELVTKLTENLTDGSFINGTISQPRMRSDELKRVRLKPVELRGAIHIQFELQFERVLEHENVPLQEVGQKIEELLNRFRQVHAEFTNETVHVQISKKFKVMWKAKQTKTTKTVDLSHNRKKNYLLDEHTPHPF